MAAGYTPRVSIFPKSNSIAFYPATPSGVNVMGQASYLQTIQPWQPILPYSQKVGFNDNIAIMVHTQESFSGRIPVLTPPKLYICDKYQNTITAINLNQAPYLKNSYALAGNNFTDPVAGTTIQLTSTLWVFNFNQFAAQIPSGGIFYLRMDNIVSDDITPAVSCYSEPIFLTDTLPNTLLFQYSYNSNIASKNIVNTGWYNDYPTNTQPYSLFFNLRCEGYINMFSPKAVNIGYLQQNYMQKQIKTLQARTWTLKIGEISTGIPYYLLEMATEAMLADTVFINNYGYILYNPQGSASLNDAWKIKDSDISPLIYASTAIMETNPAQAAIQIPYSNPITRIFDNVFDDTFS